MSSLEQVVVIGASGFGRESLDVLSAMRDNGARIEILGVIDDQPSTDSLRRLKDRGVPYLGTLNNWIESALYDVRFVLGIGNPPIRRKIATRLNNLGFEPFSAVHPSSIIGENTVIGPGAVVCAGTVISTNVRLERLVHVNPNATIGHDSILGDYVSVNPASVISGEVTLEPEVLVGAAATVLQNLKVGKKSVIGAAALVTKNVPEGVVVKGVPGVWNSNTAVS